MAVLVRINGAFDSLGSAVWIGKSGYLATCYHVVKGVNAPLAVELFHEPVFPSGNMNLVMTGIGRLYPVTVEGFDESTDVAILKANELPTDHERPMIFGLPGVTPDPPTPKGAVLDTEPLSFGLSVLLAGYPLDQNTIILQTGTYTGEGSFPEPLAKGKSQWINSRRLMLSLVSNPGNSGGPVFNPEGKVIGLMKGNLLSPLRDSDGQNLFCGHAKRDANGNIAIDPTGHPIAEPTPCVQNSGISIAVPAQYILDLAKSKGININ